MINIFVCLHCGWEWASRLDRPPLKCPKCFTPNWQREKIIRPPRVRVPKGTGHFPRKYPIDQIEIGGSIILPWPITEDGRERDSAVIHSMQCCVYQEERRFGKKFRMSGHPKGLLVERIL